MMQENKNKEELLLAYLLGELDPQQANDVSVWLAESDENLKQFEKICEIWNQQNTAKTNNFNTDQAWSKIQPKITTSPFYKSTWFRVAAAILILFAAVNVLINLNTVDSSTVLYSETEIVNQQLEDGSVITLNHHSKLSYNESFNTNTRNVKLEGEAFFDIERDTAKPFVIELDQSFVKVLGTSFNIKSEPEDELVSVFVKSGVVQFEYLSSDADSTYLSVKLHAGDKVVYNKTTRKLEPMQNSSSTVTDMYWIDQELIFDGIELGKVAQILETVYEVNIEFSDPQTKNCLLTVNFQNATIEDIMDVIASTFELQLTQQNNTFQLTGSSCEVL